MFEQSINELESGHSLGDTKVVGRLAGQFIDGVVNAANVTAVLTTVNRYADIFAGLDDSYTPVPDWNDGRHLGRLLARRLSVVDSQASIDTFRAAFGVLAREALGIVKDSVGKDDAKVQAEVEALKRYMVALLLGTVDTLYPAGKGWK
jgi:hypothetical protein